MHQKPIEGVNWQKRTFRREFRSREPGRAKREAEAYLDHLKPFIESQDPLEARLESGLKKFDEEIVIVSGTLKAAA